MSEIKKSKRGGRRPGAGRPKGARAKATELAVQRAGTDGILPLEFMLAIMRDEEADVTLRIDMAKAAAPYVHARLQSTESTLTVKRDATEFTDSELAAIARGSGTGAADAEDGEEQPSNIH